MDTHDVRKIMEPSVTAMMQGAFVRGLKCALEIAVEVDRKTSELEVSLVVDAIKEKLEAVQREIEEVQDGDA